MATFKPIVGKYKKDDGTHRVYIRVTHNRKYKDVATPFYVNNSQITRSLKIKDASILEQVEQKIAELRREITKIGFAADNLDVSELINLLYSRADNIDFIDFIEQCANEYEINGRVGTAAVHKYVATLLRDFNNGLPLYFSDFNATYMLRFYESLKKYQPNTIRNAISVIKTDYRAAAKKYNNNEAGVQVVRYGAMDLLPHTGKVTQAKGNVIPDVETMQALIDCPYPIRGDYYELAKDMYIFCFLTFGTNIADILQLKKRQINDGVLVYHRKKISRISGEDSEIQINILPAAKVIIDKYDSDPIYLFDFKSRERGHNFLGKIHYYFQQIGLEDKAERTEYAQKHGHSQYTFYSNRHTMASFARNICGVDYMTVHQMLNHAAPSEFRTTDTYLARDFRPLWEANEKLYNLFDWSFYLNQTKQN